MKQTIEIEVPEGFEAKYDPEIQKIEIIKKDNKPRTWEEFCKSLPDTRKGYVITSPGQVIESNDCYGRWLGNFCETKEEAEAFFALMQLRQLRKAWIGDWEANWKTPYNEKYTIQYWLEKLEVGTSLNLRNPLSFPTREMAKEFLRCFKDLIEQAKPLI